MHQCQCQRNSFSPSCRKLATSGFLNKCSNYFFTHQLKLILLVFAKVIGQDIFNFIKQELKHIQFTSNIQPEVVLQRDSATSTTLTYKVTTLLLSIDRSVLNSIITAQARVETIFQTSPGGLVLDIRIICYLQSNH